jgi:hypothetical protein
MTDRRTRAPDPATDTCEIHEGHGTTVISGPVADQAALHGVLQRVRDLGLPLVSVTRAYSPPHHQGDQP